MSNQDNFDLVGAIIDFESGMLASCEIVDLFQYLIDHPATLAGLQGSYQRVAARMLERGLIHVG